MSLVRSNLNMQIVLAKQAARPEEIASTYIILSS